MNLKILIKTNSFKCRLALKLVKAPIFEGKSNKKNQNANINIQNTYFFIQKYMFCFLDEKAGTVTVQQI
ncbi:hypothetical protein [Negadavirga shengliensis]|uniref:Uncharacterized protein n=1 Tax=Negadavirga shengliensis TaxID=1389218 RepID=A0ABV9T2Z5_9BACT